MRKNIIAGIFWTILFLLLIVLLGYYDVSACGPVGTSIGFSKINCLVNEFTGINLLWYEITNILGYAALTLVAVFGIIGIVQAVKRKSLRRVDFNIIALGILYVITLSFYLIFEVVVINRRPVIMEGETFPEASFPSSHTFLSIVVLGSALLQIGIYIKSSVLKSILRYVTVFAMMIIICGRLYSGVHWTTDIIGAVFLGKALLSFYASSLDYYELRKGAE